MSLFLFFPGMFKQLLCHCPRVHAFGHVMMALVPQRTNQLGDQRLI